MGTDYVFVVLVVRMCRIQDCTPVCGAGQAPPTEVSASADGMLRRHHTVVIN